MLNGHRVDRKNGFSPQKNLSFVSLPLAGPEKLRDNRRSPANLSPPKGRCQTKLSASVVLYRQVRNSHSGPPAALDVVLLGGRSHALVQTRAIRVSSLCSAAP